MNNRAYKSVKRSTIATAYGFRKWDTVLNRISERITEETPKDITRHLSDIKGHHSLLPEQVKCIVYLLGDPLDPQALFIEI